MDPKIKCILLDSISPEWKRFARNIVFDKAVIDYIDLEKHSDQLKMEDLLKKLVLRNPSDFMSVIEKSLTLMGRADILNQIQKSRKCSPPIYFFAFFVLHVFSSVLYF